MINFLESDFNTESKEKNENKIIFDKVIASQSDEEIQKLMTNYMQKKI